jgi:hypothetical protein
MSELSGLHLEKSFGNVAYSGSVLSPTSAYQPMKPITSIKKGKLQECKKKREADFNFKNRTSQTRVITFGLLIVFFSSKTIWNKI